MTAQLCTRVSEIFDLPNEDSDLKLDREVQLVHVMGSSVNRIEYPWSINGVCIFPQDNNMHDLKWDGIPVCKQVLITD